MSAALKLRVHGTVVRENRKAKDFQTLRTLKSDYERKRPLCMELTKFHSCFSCLHQFAMFRYVRSFRPFRRFLPVSASFAMSLIANFAIAVFTCAGNSLLVMALAGNKSDLASKRKVETEVRTRNRLKP